MARPKESDWKTYAKLVPMLRERYLDKRTRTLVCMLVDTKKNATERFWDTRKHYEKEEKKLDLCLGNHSRSYMFTSMLAMLKYGMLEEEELDQFSDELKEALLEARK